MVFIVSGNVNEEPKDGPISKDAEANWEALPRHKTLSSTWLLPASPHVRKSKRRSSSTTFCIIVPWVLFCLCFFMLGCVSTWGWKQHAIAQELLANIAAEKTTTTPLDTPVPKHSVAAPFASKGPHPYGNDGLAPEQPPQIEEVVINEEEDITVIEENVVVENIVVEENLEQPQAVPKDPLTNDVGLFLLPKLFLPPLVPMEDSSGVPCDDGVETADSASLVGHKDAELLPKGVDIVGISRDEFPVD